MQEAEKKYRRDMVNRLAENGRQLCLEAFKTKTTKNRTGAQANAYFYVVCYNGIVQAVGNSTGGNKDAYFGGSGSHKGLKGTWWKTGVGSDWWDGFREALGKLIRTEAPKARTSKNKFDLFVLNAAYYTSWLEDGSYAIGLAKIFGHPIDIKHYQVISQIEASCRAVANKYGNNSKVTRVGIHGEPLKPASTTSYYHYDWQEGNF